MTRRFSENDKLPECYICRKEPMLRWWPELQVAGITVYNIVALGPEGDPDVEWFMLEFPDGGWPFNPPEMRLRARRIIVREAYYQDGSETLGAYVRRKAREWLGQEQAAG